MNDPKPTQFGVLLTKFRKERGFSQSKMAQIAGLNHSYISRLENGSRRPLRYTITRLATALDIPEGDEKLDILLESMGFQPYKVIPDLENEYVKRLDRALQHANEETRLEIDAVLRFFTESLERRNGKL